ncbi:MAG TPA: ethylbenzene dehydrogenase-related protein [Thermoanaerobaculia bacterium]|nr:ethylbenzene dehydrogenase-related protein [Thermoanaerobaculia bacterium]
MTTQTPNRRWAWALAMLALAGCGDREPPLAPEVQAVRVGALPTGIDDPAWVSAPRYLAALILQDLVEPRLLEPSTEQVEVRALTDGAEVAFRLTWKDATLDDLPGASRFTDACAVQLPAAVAADVPAPQMGEDGRPVEISYWRASWQAVVDGREDSIRSLYPGARIDHYPFDAASLEPGSPEQRDLAAQYAPARALGNVMEGPRERPVQDLLAEGPGTLSPMAQQLSSGQGRRDEQGWTVVIRRPLPRAWGSASRSQVAFAVWDGGRQEVGARKMRSVWIPLHLIEETADEEDPS